MMGIRKDSVGIALGVLGKLGMVEPVADQQPQQTTAPAETKSATPEAIAKLRTDIGLDDPSSAYRVFEGILITLGDAIPDLTLRYKKALQLAEKQAVTSESIIQEFDTLKDRIEQQGGVLSATLEDLTRKKLEPKYKARTDAGAALAVKRQEVVQLERHLDEIESAIKAGEDELTAIRANFAAAAGAVTAELRQKEQTFYENLNLKKK